MSYILAATNHLLRIITSAASDIRVHASWVDNDLGDFTPDSDNTVITTATTTTIVASPASGIQSSVRNITIKNHHASNACDVTVEHYDGTDAAPSSKWALLPSEKVVYGENGIWVYYDALGKPFMSVGPVATQADMEAGTSLTAMVTPGRQHFHQSAVKCWGEFTANSTTILASYNITSVADTATGTMTVTIATDFSSANWCCMVTRAEDDLTLVYSSTYNAKTAGVVALNSAVEAGSGSDPTSSSGNASWSFCGLGDL